MTINTKKQMYNLKVKMPEITIPSLKHCTTPVENYIQC